MYNEIKVATWAETLIKYSIRPNETTVDKSSHLATGHRLLFRVSPTLFIDAHYQMLRSELNKVNSVPHLIELASSALIFRESVSTVINYLHLHDKRCYRGTYG